MKTVLFPISKITVGAGLKLDRGDVQPLAASISRDGLHQPITVRSDGQLLSGERRLRACRDVLNWSEIPAVVDDNLSREKAAWIENLHREDLMMSQKMELAKRLVATKELTAQEAADVLGMSRRTLFHGFKVMGIEDPELTALMDSGELSHKHAAELAEQSEERRREIMALPPKERREAIRAQRPTSKSRPQQGPSFKLLPKQMSSLQEQVAAGRELIETSSLEDRPKNREGALLLIEELQAYVAAIDGAPKPKRRRRKRKPVREPRCSKVKMSEESLDKRWASLSNEKRRVCQRKAEVAGSAQDLHARDGVPLREACDIAAKGSEWQGSTIYSAVIGRDGQAGLDQYPRTLWPLVLAPKHIGGGRETYCDPAAWAAYKTDYLRPEEPTHEQCFRNLQRIAKVEGWTIPQSSATLKRRLEREVHRTVITLKRKGRKGLRRTRPAQIRDRSSLRAMELVCADGRKGDTRVLWPDGEIARYVMVAFQDVFSGNILSYRVDRTESADCYRLAFHDLVKRYGVPTGVLVDNGRGIASNMLTGGCHWRFRRSKPQPDEAVGMITALVGADNVHWAKPAHGQAKPVERFFRNLATDLDKDHRLRGAYCGPDPTRKPANYDEKRAVPLADFLKVVEDVIREQNSRSGRRGQGMSGESFDAMFKTSYELHAAEIPRLSTAQIDRWLLATEVVTAYESTGEVRLHGARYCSETLSERLAGRPKEQRRVVLRYDPDHLDQAVVVEDLEGRLIARADPMEPVPFLSSSAARETARDDARLNRLAREEAAIHNRMSERKYDALLDQAAAETRDAEEPPEQGNVRAAKFELTVKQKQAAREEEAIKARRAATDSLVIALADQEIGFKPTEDE